MFIKKYLVHIVNDDHYTIPCRNEKSTPELQMKSSTSQMSHQHHSQQSVPSGSSLSHPLRPLSTLDSGMYTSSDDESDHEEGPSNQHHLESHHPQSPSQRMKFTTFGKSQSIREETLFEEGKNLYFLIFEWSKKF